MEEIKQPAMSSEQSPANQKTPIAVHNNQQASLPQSTFLVTLLSVLLLISCLIAGFFAWQTQTLVKELQEIRIVKSETPTPTPTIEPLPIIPIASGSATPMATSVACTMEAIICPDGSAVGRSGPKCEFAPCPTIKP